MASVLPKAKMFLFLSIICLIVNISVCVVAFADQDIKYNEYLENKDDLYYSGEFQDSGNNVTIGNVALSTTSAFIPYFSIINLAVLGIDADVSVVIGVILGLISTIQLFLLITIILNFTPKILGSGIDV